MFRLSIAIIYVVMLYCAVPNTRLNAPLLGGITSNWTGAKDFIFATATLKTIEPII